MPFARAFPAAIAIVCLALAGCGSEPTGSSPTSSTSPASSTTTAATSGVYGTVTAGPTCPVERAGQPCQPSPVSGRVDAKDATGRLVTGATTDAAGRYTLELAPGTWELVVDTGAPLPRCPPTTVVVSAGSPTKADITCDSGIR